MTHSPYGEAPVKARRSEDVPSCQVAGSGRDAVAGSVLDLRAALPRGLRWMKGPIERALGVTAARAALGEAAYLEGKDFVEGLLAALEIQPDLAACGEIPASGPLVVVANHHFGTVDAMLALSIVLPVRPDLKVVANLALADFPQLRGLTIPVPVSRARHDEGGDGARKLVRHLRAGGAVLIFPAGRVAERGRRGVVEDHPWSPGVGRLVRLCGAAVVPLAFEGGNSRSFYLARRVHFRLGTLLLLRELLNKRGRRIPVRIGEPIPYAQASETPAVLTERLRHKTYGLLRSAPTAQPLRRG